MVAWTTPTMVAQLLGPGAGDEFTADPLAQLYCDVANSWCYRKRFEAGYVDDNAEAAAAPDPPCGLAAGLYARDNWRERASTEGFPSYEGITSYVPTGGVLGRIRQLLGIGKAQVDLPPLEPVVTPYGIRRALRYLR